MNLQSLKRFATGILVRELGNLLGFKLFFTAYTIDHPPASTHKYLPAFEKVETFTPLIFPSLISWFLIKLGLTYVSFVVEVYLISVGRSMPLL